MQYESRAYMCPICEHRYKVGTNHIGEIYSLCPKCHTTNPQMCVEPEALAQRETVPTAAAAVHYYRFDTRWPGGAILYHQLVRELKEKFEEKIFKQTAPIPAHGSLIKTVRQLGAYAPNHVFQVELMLHFTPGGQWITSTGLRLHDWHEFMYPNKDIKEGYYLDITDELKRLPKSENIGERNYYGVR